jgi:hypothetical protein
LIFRGLKTYIDHSGWLKQVAAAEFRGYQECESVSDGFEFDGKTKSIIGCTGFSSRRVRFAHHPAKRCAERTLRGFLIEFVLFAPFVATSAFFFCCGSAAEG